METRGILLEVAWAPREQNAEADAITNGITHWLNKDKQVGADIVDLRRLAG